MPRRGFESGRLFGPDLARGIALLGMFAAHVVFDPDENVYDGRSAILFATIAGVSLGLLTGGARPPERGRRGPDRGAVALRGLSLIVIGVFLTAVVHPPLAVILDAYGFAFLLMVPLLFARWPVLLASVVAVVATMPALVAWLRDTWTIADVPAPAVPFAEWLVFGTYPMAIWIAFPLVGLLCARADLRRLRTKLWMLGGGALAAVLGYGAAGLVPGVSAEAHSGTVAEVVGSGGVAIAVSAAAALVGDVPGRAGRGIRWVLFPVAAAGAMALTLYTAQAIALAITRDIVRGDSSAPWEYPAPTLTVLTISALVVGTLWRLFLGAGPLERVLRFVSSMSRPRAPKV